MTGLERINEKGNTKIGRNTQETKQTYSEKKNPRQLMKNKNGEMKCHNCNEFGHIAKHCSKEKRIYKCFRCGEEGHTSR